MRQKHLLVSNLLLCLALGIGCFFPYEDQESLLITNMIPLLFFLLLLCALSFLFDKSLFIALATLPVSLIIWFFVVLQHSLSNAFTNSLGGVVHNAGFGYYYMMIISIAIVALQLGTLVAAFVKKFCKSIPA